VVIWTELLPGPNNLVRISLDSNYFAFHFYWKLICNHVFEKFRNYIIEKTGVGSVTTEQFAFIESVCLMKKLRRRQYFLQEGDVCKYNAFVLKGCLRTYSVDQEGVEHIISFAVEDWWAGDRESLTSGNPSRFNIDAIEDSELLLISQTDFLEISKRIPVFQEMINTIFQKSFIKAQNRIQSVISDSAEDKYLHFLKNNIALANRIPQSMIASYLGISAETLSRIRKQIIKRNQ